MQIKLERHRKWSSSYSSLSFYPYHTEPHEILSKYSHFPENFSVSVLVEISTFKQKLPYVKILHITFTIIVFTHTLIRVFFYHSFIDAG